MNVGTDMVEYCAQLRVPIAVDLLCAVSIQKNISTSTVVDDI